MTRQDIDFLAHLFYTHSLFRTPETKVAMFELGRAIAEYASKNNPTEFEAAHYYATLIGGPREVVNDVKG